MLLDELMPQFEAREHHSIAVDASAELVRQILPSLPLTDSLIVRILFRLRGLPADAVTIETAERAGFTRLDEDDHEIVLGLIGKFWTPFGSICRTADFRTFNEPGFAKAAWNFTVTPLPRGCQLATETRVHCTDSASGRKFRIYWTFVGPFSALIRRLMLRKMKKKIESMA